MKKRYVITAISIIAFSFGLIALFTKFLYASNEGPTKKKVSYADVRNSVESVEYYLYDKCDDSIEKEHITMNYFLIDDYFLVNDEFLDIIQKLEDKETVLLSNNRCMVKDNCQDTVVKKIVINMEDDGVFVLNNMCNDNNVNEFIDYVDSYYHNLLKTKAEESKKSDSKKELLTYNANNIDSVKYSDSFPWFRNNEIEGFELLIKDGKANFYNDSTYYSSYKESYDVDNNNWNNLLKYIEKNISSIDNPDVATCLDGGMNTVTIKLKSGDSYDIHAYCGGDDSFKELFAQIDKAVGVGKIANYKNNVRKYNMANDIINSPVEEITIVEEPGNNEYSVVITPAAVTFYLKKYDNNNKFQSEINKSFALSSDTWEKIVKYINESTTKDNLDTLDQTITVKRSNGNSYSSDIYNKFFEVRTYNKIIDIIGSKTFNDYKKEFQNMIASS